jgi:uncharacterized protein YdhG (YjbR/CyaY superfamily)
MSFCATFPARGGSTTIPLSGLTNVLFSRAVTRVVSRITCGRTLKRRANRRGQTTMKKSQRPRKPVVSQEKAGKKSATRTGVTKPAAGQPSSIKKVTTHTATAKKVAIKKAAGKNGAVKKTAVKKPAEKGVMRARHVMPKTIDEYIAGFSPEVQVKLQQVRATIRQAAPDAQETISYQMPAFTQQGNVIYFAGYEHHIGIYPAPRGIEQFKQELAAYEGGKGTIKLPHDRPLPLDLIRRIVEFKVQSNLEKAAAKRPRRK